MTPACLPDVDANHCILRQNRSPIYFQTTDWLSLLRKGDRNSSAVGIEQCTCFLFNSTQLYTTTHKSEKSLHLFWYCRRLPGIHSGAFERLHTITPQCRVPQWPNPQLKATRVGVPKLSSKLRWEILPGGGGTWAFSRGVNSSVPKWKTSPGWSEDWP